ncbi:MAG: molybdopterin-dependent oxidoreductase, partial [Spirochaetaceae bacterium]|nr:molybdopterin-dependent oxidoreductase [Spirochaetaceae bacterium]
MRKPLLRTGPRGSGEFQEISWDRALDAVAERLSDVMHSHGPEAVMDFGGSGACKGALHNTGRLTSRFLNQLGPVTRMVGNYSFQAASFVLPYAYGTAPTGYDARTLLDTRFVILWGANIADTRFGNEAEQVIRHVKNNGGEVIAIDPRNTRTAKQCATEWIPILPGTDTAAMLAIAWVLFSEALIDTKFIESHVHGVDDLERYVSGTSDGIAKDPKWAAAICGIPAETIRNLARRYGRAKPAALVPGFSIQRALGGEDAFRMSVALQALSGNTGLRGGTPGTNMWIGPPGTNMWMDPPGPTIHVLEAPPAAGPSVPKATWPRAILGGKAAGFAADIKAVYVTGNNYLNQGSDIARNVQAFESLDLVVCHDIFLTPTARYADIVLPATHSLEREDVVVPEDNYLYYSAKIFDPVGEARNDFDIFADLSRRLGLGDLFDEGLSKEEWVDRIIDTSSITEDDRAEFKATGIYDGGEHERYGLAPFISDPAKNPLDTPSGK